MRVADFFIWCTGSDTSILKKCTKAERIKHIGFGTLVIVPAILAFISMTFALSTLEGIQEYNLLHYLGGLIWGLIIFSFDRFIVSTHRRKENNTKEFQNPSFYLRFLFAFILGIVISHPLVMLYFNGSILDQLKKNDELSKFQIAEQFDSEIILDKNQIYYWDSLLLEKKIERNEQAAIIANEIDGEVLANKSGLSLTTGLKGKGPSAEQKISHLNVLNSELEQIEAKANNRFEILNMDIEKLKEDKAIAIAEFNSSTDYLKRELALQQLKEGNNIVGITQWFLICLFILVDILPVVFKTFAPFGMYDKILNDDESIIADLDNSSRFLFNQKIYNSINQSEV